MNCTFGSSNVFCRVAVVVIGAAFAPAIAQADLLSIGPTAGGGLGIGVNAGVATAGVTIGGGSVANVKADVGGLDARANVGGASGVTACVGNCSTATTPGTPGGPGNPVVPGTPGTPVAEAPAGTKLPVAPKHLACAQASGNTTAFNGYPLQDKDGRVLGVIHSAELDGKARIRSVSIQNVKKQCTLISRTNFTVAGYAITGAFDARKSGMVFTN